MKLIAHSFLEEYLPTSRCRKLRTRFQYGAMPVTLAEPSESDFPVAFIVHNFGTTYEFEGRSEDVSGLRPEDYSERVLGYFDNEIRAYKGRLFQAMRASDRYYMAPGWLALDDAGYFIDDYGCRGYYQDNTLPESAVVKTSTEEETISRLKEKASGYVIFDGKVWQECGEPMYQIATFGLGHNHGGTGFFITYAYNNNIPAKNYFNALHRDEAIEYGKKIALGRGDTESVERIVHAEEDITVLMPELVRRNPMADHKEGGDAFMTMLEGLVSSFGSAAEAGLIAIAATAAEVNA